MKDDPKQLHFGGALRVVTVEDLCETFGLSHRAQCWLAANCNGDPVGMVSEYIEALARANWATVKRSGAKWLADLGTFLECNVVQDRAAWVTSEEIVDAFLAGQARRGETPTSRRAVQAAMPGIIEAMFHLLQRRDVRGSKGSRRGYRGLRIHLPQCPPP